MASNRSDWYRRRRIEDWQERFDRGYGGDYGSNRARRPADMDWERRASLEREYEPEDVIEYSDYYAGQEMDPDRPRRAYERPGGWMERRGPHEEGENVDWQEGRYWQQRSRPRLPYRERRYSEHFADPDFDYEYDQRFGTREWFPEERISGSRSPAQRRWESYGEPGTRTGRREVDRERAQAGTGERGFVYGWQGEPYDMDFEYKEFWNTPGPYTGMGPQDYHRSDEHIREEILDRLTENARVDARQMQVQVQDGQVTLTGTAENRRQKRLAERIAEDTRGVTEVTNQLMLPETQAEGRTPGFWGEAGDASEAVRTGMDVVGQYGQYIGRVKQVRQDDFLVDRPLARDVYVPRSSVERVDREVVLNITVDQVGDQDWERPPLF